MLRTALLALALSASPALAAERPVVVELFTSQGCSSCPPADAYLAELAKRDDVLALSFHVDYWNYIGWKDPFATAETTQRQRDYARNLAQRYVYTPEMVVQGAAHAVGSDRPAVEKLIAAARARPGPEITAAPEGDRLRAAPEGDGLRVRVGEGAGAGTLLLVRFEREHVTKVGRGENGGRTLRNVHVVRELRPIGEWRGKALDLALEKQAGECALLLQAEAGGAILAALRLR
jgi:hypothetical protein